MRVFGETGEQLFIHYVYWAVTISDVHLTIIVANKLTVTTI